MKKLRAMAAIYCIFVGISMIGMWLMFYFTKSIPELETKPIEIGLHLFAEVATALLLITAGVGVIRLKAWGIHVYFIAMGMLLYTLLNSPGYFLQRGEYGLVIMFGALVTGAIFLTIAMFIEVRKKTVCKAE